MAHTLKGLVFFTLTLAIAGRVSADSYPSFPADPLKLYPYDALPVSTPDPTKGDQDPGGYFRDMYTCTMSDAKSLAPKTYTMYGYCMGMDIWSQNIYKKRGKEAYGIFNCTADTTENILKAETPSKDLSDLIGMGFDEKGVKATTSMKWCGKGECCDKRATDPNKGNLFTYSSEKMNQRIGVALEFAKSDSCTGVHLGHVCAYLYLNDKMCTQNYLSLSKRVYIFPCPDLMITYWNTCKLLAASTKPIADRLKSYETAKYFTDNAVSNKVMIQMLGVAYNYDRVCRPYSYYFPGNDGTAFAAAPSAPAATPTPAAASSAASYTVILSLALVGLAMIA